MTSDNLMIKDREQFKSSIKEVLCADDGLSIESEGTVYVRSLEGEYYCAGILANDGGIEMEHEYEEDLDAAVEYFLTERE